MCLDWIGAPVNGVEPPMSFLTVGGTVGGTVWASGGPDETRTRNFRRDRPVL